MRKLVPLLTVWTAFQASTLLAANDVGSVYAVLKEQRYDQADNSNPTLKSDQPYRFEIYVSQASGGTVTGGTITPPASGSVHTTQSLAPQNDGLGSWGFQQKFDTFPALNAAFGDGAYAVHVTGANGTYNSQLTLSSEVYPAEVPQLTNTNFNGGVLVVDPTKSFMATWNAFADHGPNDVIVFDLSENNGPTILQQILAPDATSQLIPANFLDPNESYQISLIFVKASSTKTTDIPGSTGVGGYSLNTKIQVSPAPVPTLFASINGTAQNGGGSIFQYTPAGDESEFASDLDRPRGLAFDSAGNLFVATDFLDSTSGNFQGAILKITRDGAQSTFASGFNTNFFVGSLATDRFGNVFAMAQNSNDPNLASTIYKFTPGGTRSTFASISGQGFGLAFDSGGNLYAADGSDRIIYKFTPNATQSVFAGPGSFSGVQGPTGLAFDRFGNLFVSTEGNFGNAGGDAILKFTPNGTPSTFATELSHPRGLVFNSAGTLFVAEVIPDAPGDILEFDAAGTGTGFASNLGRPQGNGGAEYLACNEFPVIIGGNHSESATVGQQFIYQIAATNQPGFYGASALPPGLTIDASTGLIYGIPTVSGNFPITLSAWNPCGTGLGNLALAIQPAPAGPEILSSTSATGRTGQPFQFQVLATGNTSSTRLSTSPLPPGLTVDAVTGLISGTPTADGNFSITLTVTDGAASTSAALQLTFTSDPDIPVITSSDTALLTPGQFFSRKLTADASSSWGYIGADGLKHEGPSSEGLPPGLSFDGVNLISGTYTPPSNRPNGTALAIGGSSATTPTAQEHAIRPYTITIRPRLIISCQPVATNDHGTTTAPLNFFEGSSNIMASQPPNITVEATGTGGSAVSFTTPTVTDGNAINLPVTCNPSSGSTFPVGQTTVACTSAADNSGGYVIVTFTVTVQDTTPPVLTAMPHSITVGAQKSSKSQPQGATINFASQLSATDIVDGKFTPTASPPSGSFFPLGNTMVNVTATDKHGNSSVAGTFMVTVNAKVKKPKAPSISVSVSSPAINEGGSAVYTISATTANPSQPTVVQYSISGTATPAGQFYTLSGTPNQVTIPSGASSATVTLDALTNPLSIGSETAMMTIGSGSGYKVSKTTKSATVTINNGP